jgi:hypothetical protein
VSDESFYSVFAKWPKFSNFPASFAGFDIIWLQLGNSLMRGTNSAAAHEMLLSFSPPRFLAVKPVSESLGVER